MVRVQILANYNAVLDLEVLSGPNAGWRQTDNDGLRSAYIAAYAGLASSLIFAFVWLRSPATDE
jgi:hypothetical protein